MSQHISGNIIEKIGALVLGVLLALLTIFLLALGASTAVFIFKGGWLILKGWINA